MMELYFALKVVELLAALACGAIAFVCVVAAALWKR